MINVLDTITERNGPLVVTGISGAAQACFIVKLYRYLKQSTVIVTASAKMAEQLLDDLRFFGDKEMATFHTFPAYNVTPFKLLSYQGQIAAERIGTLYRLTEGGEPSIIVTTIEALSARLIPKNILLQYAELIMVGESLDRDLFAKKLAQGGYSQTVLVEEPGDFCLRGGIIDVYPPLHEHPIRIELFGDLVESIRSFSTSSQRSKSSMDEVVILPAREAIIDRAKIDEISTRLRMQAAAQGLSVTRVRELTGRLKAEGALNEIEGFLSIIYSGSDTLFDYLSETTMMVLLEPAEISNAAKDLADRIDRSYEAACEESHLCVEPENLYLPWERVEQCLVPYRPVMIKRLAINPGGDHPLSIQLPEQSQVALDVIDNDVVKAEMVHTGNKEVLLQPLVKWLLRQSANSHTTLVLCYSKARTRSLEKMLIAYDIEPNRVDSVGDVEFESNGIWLTVGNLSSGFVWPDASLSVITEAEIFDSRPIRSKRPLKRRQAPPPNIADLNSGDLIVHIDHGIGRYEGLVKLTVNGLRNDFLLVIYKDDDRLYLPVDRMGMIEKYMGVDDVLPSLDKMGGLSWARAKARVQRSAEKIAGELLELYAARKINQGFAFRDPAHDYEDFTASFAFEETRDQKKVIADVMADMARPMPMDRLVCGDVGYGKTEVALRAAYLACENTKQVAMVVPTTILAEQHFSTFSARFNRTTYTVSCLSRFRSSGHQKEIIKQLKSGGVDIVIGTHRLFSKDVKFKDLGLVILDEEQRFGVKHKEKLKQMRKTVDVLALTATPIPRTLHLSLTGVRDISTISTPPEFRQAIATYVCEYEESVIQDAIKRELDRGGQIYFVHNDIAGIERMADRLKQLVPEVRLDIAHGRMHEDALEETMYRFQRGDIDMLVCTTIIESGLDVSTANTMLVNRADRFGLAQMYQLRGRVGRSNRQAYAYLIINRESTLTQSAKKRLKVLMAHSDLGSGFQIAMHDLKIRGGGTILGAAQSGHIAAVGYDMFLKLMKDAVAKLKGQTTVDALEPEINLPLEAHIPEDYMPEIDQRLATYRRLARMKEPEEASILRGELKDRFGDPPEAVKSLLVKILLRILAISAGVKRLDIKEGQLVFHLSVPHLKNPSGIIDWISANKRKYDYNLSTQHILTIHREKGNLRRALSQTKNILKEMVRHANS